MRDLSECILFLGPSSVKPVPIDRLEMKQLLFLVGLGRIFMFKERLLVITQDRFLHTVVHRAELQ